jgi:hypothetical protein
MIRTALGLAFLWVVVCGAAGPGVGDLAQPLSQDEKREFVGQAETSLLWKKSKGADAVLYFGQPTDSDRHVIIYLGCCPSFVPAGGVVWNKLHRQ